MIRFPDSRLPIRWLQGGLVVFLLSLLAWRLTAGHSYNWQWERLPQYIWRFDEATGQWTGGLILEGFFTTIRLSVWSSLLATLIGAVMGICRCAPRLFLRLISGFYVESIRNLPPLIIVFIFYFFFSDQIMPLLGVDEMARSQPEHIRSLLRLLAAPPHFVSEFIAAVIALAVFEGAYITEIVRAGIQGIEKGQWEAAAALGFSCPRRMIHVILPQAFRQTLPSLAGQFISTIKDSSIVSVISIQELTFQGMELMAATYMTFEIWITVTILYFVLTAACALAVSLLEQRFRVGRAPSEIPV